MKYRDQIIIGVIIFCAIVIGTHSSIGKHHPPNYKIDINHLIQQPDDITCGPTSVSMLMYYYNLDVSVNDVKKITKTVWYNWSGHDIGMTSPNFIVSALKFYGFNSKMKYGKIIDLKHTISNGKPCIVLVRSGEWNWHYVLACGYDTEYIFFANPSTGEIQGLSTNEFNAAWSWNADLHGRLCGQLAKYFLKGIEIYPNSYIFVE